MFVKLYYMSALAHISGRTREKLTEAAASAKTTRELRVRGKLPFHWIVFCPA